MKKAIFCILMTLLLLACGKGQGDNTPKGVVTQYAEAIIHGKYLEALKSCISSETKSTPEGAKYQNRSQQLEFVKMEGPGGFS